MHGCPKTSGPRLSTQSARMHEDTHRMRASNIPEDFNLVLYWVVYYGHYLDPKSMRTNGANPLKNKPIGLGVREQLETSITKRGQAYLTLRIQSTKIMRCLGFLHLIILKMVMGLGTLHLGTLTLKVRDIFHASRVLVLSIHRTSRRGPKPVLPTNADPPPTTRNLYSLTPAEFRDPNPKAQNNPKTLNDRGLWAQKPYGMSPFSLMVRNHLTRAAPKSTTFSRAVSLQPPRAIQADLLDRTWGRTQGGAR